MEAVCGDGVGEDASIAVLDSTSNVVCEVVSEEERGKVSTLERYIGELFDHGDEGVAENSVG